MSTDESNGSGPVSRRDFLRRAGKETAETGVRLIPGARLAQTAIIGDSRTGKPNWWQRIAAWRQGHTAREREDAAEGSSDAGA